MDLSVLNKEQREAVECLEGPLLVLAGAGSGKTRVLTYRIANLVEHGVSPWNILALTFTNKAAGEMRERTEGLIGRNVSDMWVMTFHSFCARMLRMDIDKLGRERTFVIYDDADQMSLIGEIIKQLGLAEKDIPKREIKERIGEAKNRSTDPIKYLSETYADADLQRIYKQYERRLKEVNALDFDDLLLKSVELLTHCPDVLDKYRSKFRYVLIDEYQDTNLIQYRLVELLCREHRNICVVGDDDQSIYGWRGADIRNILGFEKDFKNAKVIRLEQNYRSTSNILDAANAVIDHNRGRKKKTLWTAEKGGDRISIYTADTERDEAAYICRKILEGVRAGDGYDDFAVLYRMNAQSRVLEGTLMNFGIPYRIYGGQRFYDRREIKDIMAYLRLIYNPNDDIALQRIINVPKRGIGDVTVADASKAARENGMSMLMAIITGTGLSDKIIKKLAPFADSMTEFIALCRSMKLSEFVKQLINMLEYEKFLIAEDKKADVESRMQNIYELIGNIMEIEEGQPEDADTLQLFLENVALVSDIDAMKEENGTVSLMTLHSAKGLEFKTVFIPGMEERVFPTSRACSDMAETAMEEERRLCYVGITRARRRLYLLNARQRMLFGSTSYNRRSRFVDEIPAALADDQTPQQSAQRYERTTAGESTMHAGFGAHISRSEPPKPVEITEKQLAAFDCVEHAKFGRGTVLEVSGIGATMMVTIEFEGLGVKKLAAAYAPLTKVTED